MATEEELAEVRPRLLGMIDESRIVTVESEIAAADLVRLEGVETVFNLHSVHNAVSTGTPVQKRLRTRLGERV